MSIATIDFSKKEITLTIPYETAKDMADIIEVAENALDDRDQALKMAAIEPELERPST